MKKYFLLIKVYDAIVYITLIGIIIYGKILGYRGYDAFLSLTVEDGPAENLTAVFLFAGSVVFGIKAYRSLRNRNFTHFITNLIFCVVFFFGMGEEISWGQRIFHLNSGEFFLEKNAQAEINFHNLNIDGVDINKVIFSKLMFVGIIFYFILLKPLTRWWDFAGRMVKKFDIPVPRYHHIVFLLVSALLVVTIHLRRESELYEMALAGILFLVFLNPADIKIRDDN
jgi:hypothetical protein